MNEKKAIFIIDILKNIINVYFDTFFVFYFFNVANYEVIPLAKYYIMLYLCVGIGFFLIRKAMKKNIKVPYFRIGISLQALYISLIMLLKENIINYVFLVGLVKGIADGFYHFPKNILNTEKVTNNDRQKFDGIINIVNKITAIIIPLLLGVLLTFFSYTALGKIFFVLFIVMFIVSFYLDDKNYYYDKKFEIKKLIQLFKTNKNLRSVLLEPLLSGMTYSSGVMVIIVTLSKIYLFKTNLNLGFVNSICSLISLISSVLFALKIKQSSFKKVMVISGIVSFITLILFAFLPIKENLILYLLVRNSFITSISLISSNVVTNYSNSDELKNELKPEFYFVRDMLYSLSRSAGYIILLFVCLLFGKEKINYIMILPAICIFIEAIVIGKISTRKL